MDYAIKMMNIHGDPSHHDPWLFMIHRAEQQQHMLYASFARNNQSATNSYQYPDCDDSQTPHIGGAYPASVGAYLTQLSDRVSINPSRLSGLRLTDSLSALTYQRGKWCAGYPTQPTRSRMTRATSKSAGERIGSLPCTSGPLFPHSATFLRCSLPPYF